MGTKKKLNMEDGEKPRHFIREWRKHRGLTQEQLAGRLDATTSSISQLENGKQGYSQVMLEAIAEALGCSPADLLIRNPLKGGAVWSIQDNLEKAPPERQKEILEVVTLLLSRSG